MSKVFGYSKRQGQDWFPSDAYSDKEIEAIRDPEGGNEEYLPTAIPTPFARIDLVKTAFINISKSPDLKAYRNKEEVLAGLEDERLVSYTLDLLELLFNRDQFKDQLRIILWDRKAELAKLLQGSEGNRRLGEALSLYLTQDQEAYNFDLMDRIFLIKYGHKIIGATSPVTLFFPTADSLTGAQVRLMKDDLLFHDKYTPLYQRDADFQKYVYLMFKANPILTRRMKVFEVYLEKSMKRLAATNPTLFDVISRSDVSAINTQYPELDTGTAGEMVEVLGVSLRKKRWEDTVQPLKNSDFAIRATKQRGDLTPLVLQNNLTRSFRYVNDPWNYQVKVPYFDAEPILERRTLPGLQIKYPYLTVSDFLETSLIRLVYPVNGHKFFDGNLSVESGSELKGYILPLKTRFFDFFNPDDLISSGPGKPRIELFQGLADSVRVVLKIPVQKAGEYISFERMYYLQSSVDGNTVIDEDQKSGVIVEHQFGISIFPFIRIEDPAIYPYYRVQLVDRDVSASLKAADYDLKFFSQRTNESLQPRAKKVRGDKKDSHGVSPATTQYYVLENNFDYIQVQVLNAGIASGIILPQWPTWQPGQEVFSFAVDFGTTNTHIEYRTSGTPPKPFDITPQDLQLATLLDPAKTHELGGDFGGSGAIAILELIDEQFVPALIGQDSEYKFPHRTVIAESATLNIATETFSLADFNIPFVYERRPEKDKYQSNLKWAQKEPGNEKRVKAFLEILMMLVRNKVLFNKGNLAHTRLVWFYPSSMKPGRIGDLRAAWTTLFDKYFKPLAEPIAITESLAPFYYFKSTELPGGAAFKPVVSVDIGGGTTDIVVFKENKPLLLTSFKCSANTVFGDAFNSDGAAKQNQMVQKYATYYEDLLQQNKHHELVNVLSLIKAKNRSEDINAFFFSIVNNPKVSDKDAFSYNALLAKDEDLKIIFLYFYAAIVYHIASLMKVRSVPLPKNVVFSGTGSKILSIITPDSKMLGTLTRKIFESVYGQAFDRDGLTIVMEKDKPKEVTCKGGLLADTADLEIEPKEIKTVLTCLEDQGINNLYYEELTDANKADIVKYVQAFNQFFVNLNRDFSFIDHFNVSPKSWGVFTEEVEKHLRDYLDHGILFNRKLDKIVGTDRTELEESLFFYPIIGSINQLTKVLPLLTPLNPKK